MLGVKLMLQIVAIYIDVPGDCGLNLSAHAYIYTCIYDYHMGVSKNRGTPKSSILIGFSIVNHPFWDTTIFGNTHIYT